MLVRLKEFLQWIWPTLEPLTPEEKAEDDERARHLASSVQASDLSKDSEVALDESRRLFDAEVDRRKGADAKAGIYLAAITALIPVLVSLLPTLWTDKSSRWMGCLGLFFFGWAVAYLLGAGAWAFRTLKVEGFAQLSPGEMVRSWKKISPKAALAKQLSSAVLYNYPLVNRKVTGIKMTHEYLLRAFLSFTFLLVLQVLWPVGEWIAAEAGKLISPDVISPLIMCYS